MPSTKLNKSSKQVFGTYPNIFKCLVHSKHFRKIRIGLSQPTWISDSLFVCPKNMANIFKSVSVCSRWRWCKHGHWPPWPAPTATGLPRGCCRRPGRPLRRSPPAATTFRPPPSPSSTAARAPTSRTCTTPGSPIRPASTQWVPLQRNALQYNHPSCEAKEDELKMTVVIVSHNCHYYVNHQNSSYFVIHLIATFNMSIIAILIALLLYRTAELSNIIEAYTHFAQDFVTGFLASLIVHSSNCFRS